MNIEYINPNDLKPYENNPRINDEDYGLEYKKVKQMIYKKKK